MRVELHRGAEEDLSETAAVLATEGPGLADAFLATALLAIEGLREFPRKGRLLDAAGGGEPELRAVRLQRFPYKVIYALHEDLLLVIAVSHERRHPRYWKGRT